MLSSVAPISVNTVSNRSVSPNNSLVPANDTKRTPQSGFDQQDLSKADLQVVQQLKARDLEVKTHEQAHLHAAAGIALSGANFTYATGPDGRRYAIGGEVNIDISDVPGDPEATLRKAESIRRAALAPARPSTQDHRMAAHASAMANQARVDLAQQGQSEIPSSKINRVDITV